MIVSNLEEWHTRRLEQWGQTPQTRIPDFEAAIKLIERVGIATLFAVSPEIPNLFQAFMVIPKRKAIQNGIVLPEKFILGVGS